MEFSDETNNAIENTIKNNLYANYGLTDKGGDNIYLCFIYISNDYVENKLKEYHYYFDTTECIIL